MMTEQSSKSFAFAVDAGGQAGPVDISSVSAPSADGLVWAHIYLQDEAALEWLATGSGLDPIIVEALSAPETRPRFTRMGDGAIVNLRGVNLNPDAKPEDMISIRMWVEKGRVVSVYLRPLQAVRSIADRMSRGHGPKDAARFVTELADGLVDRTQPIVAGLNDLLNSYEEQIIDNAGREMRTRLAKLRQRVLRLKRFIAPQREALVTMSRDDAPWLDKRARAKFQDILDDATRHMEELDNMRDRAGVLQDEVESRLADALNKNLYVLAIVSVIFLPLGFVTGLLGINVGGIPGAEYPGSFAIVVGLLLLGAVAEYAFLKWKGWL